MTDNSGNNIAGNNQGHKYDMRTEVSLAVIIPAYKKTFLEDALASLANQTSPWFRVYVGDDCSPDDLAEICHSFGDQLCISYHRFTENLGHVSLAAQWNRCIELSTESWIWLFADDDTTEKDCVERFYQVLGETNASYDIYRFNTLTIDSDGRVVKVNRPHPESESAIDFAYHRLHGNRDSYASEYIFSRTVYNKYDGMMSFPLAWCSDDASWINFGSETGIRTVDGPHVLWRRSGLNITSIRRGTVPEKLKAAALFLNELTNRFSAEEFDRSKVPQALFEEAQKDWFYGQFQTLAPISLSLWLNWPVVPDLLAGERKVTIFARMVYIHLFYMTQIVVRLIKKIVVP